MKTELEKYLDSFGDVGSFDRLAAIANLDLGKRSNAACRVMEKRNRRMELIEMGLSYEAAATIVSREFKEKGCEY